MSTYPTLSDAQIAGKRVLLRAGFDLPMEGDVVTDTSRVEALIPTMRFIIDHGASLIIMAHQGRPKGKVNPEFTQKPLVPVLEKYLGTTVHFADSCTGSDAQAKASSLKAGEVLLLENLRYDAREEKNDPEFAKELASLGDIYVNDAFTNCHRAHASMVGVPALLPSYMGLQLSEEVMQLSKITDNPKRPLALIISGAKVETKVPVINFFLDKGDDILLGGAIANTFVAATGKNVGASLYEADFAESARTMISKSGSAKIHVPSDAVVSTDATGAAPVSLVSTDAISAEQAIFDLGSATIASYIEAIDRAATVVWNGPLGLYETEAFAGASKKIAEAVARATTRGAVTIIGGGDTIDLHIKYHLPLDAYTFVSTGGGAMLEFVSGKELPALKALLQ